MITVTELAAKTLRRLGDTNARTFSFEEIETHLVDGYDDFVREVRPLFDVEPFEDAAACGNYNYAFENRFMNPYTWEQPFLTGLPGGGDNFLLTAETIERAPIIERQSATNFSFERKYLVGVDTEFTILEHHFERDHNSVARVAATIELSKLVLQPERVCWDGRRLEPLSSNSMGAGLALDWQYESIYGETSVYIADKDGNRLLRRHHIPAGAGKHLNYMGQWGTLRAGISLSTSVLSMRFGWFARMTAPGVVFAPDIAISISWGFSFGVPATVEANGLAPLGFNEDLVAGSWGVIRKLPGWFPAPRTWGLVRALRYDSRNTKVEVQRRGHDPRTEGYFEVQDHHLKYFRFFAMWRAYRRDGPLQDLILAQHFLRRYNQGVDAAKMRVAKANAMRRVVMGSKQSDRPYRPPLARPPFNYPGRWYRRRF